MAYGLRYYKEITHEDGKVIRLEIYKKDSSALAVEIGGVVRALSLCIQGQQSDIDTPIVKTSLNMTFVDAPDVENGRKNGFWEEFYTPDAILWQVVLKAKNAGETAFKTIWGGYVTPDSFSESLIYRGDVTITARDNIGHLQDFPFDAEGDADGLISLKSLVDTAWSKIGSPMSLVWQSAQMMRVDGVTAHNTMLNVSAFEGMNWYEAVEKSLYSYGLVMRYGGDNKVNIGALRYLPNLGFTSADSVPHLEPVFVSGATRELIPSVKRVEETVSYDLLNQLSMPQVQEDDFTGDIKTSSYTTTTGVSYVSYAWMIRNTEQGKGWVNNSNSTYFNPHGYDTSEVEEEDLRYMWIGHSPNAGARAEYSRYVMGARMTLELAFGGIHRIVSGVLKPLKPSLVDTITVSVYAKQNGITEWLNSDGEWQTAQVSIPCEVSEGKTSVVIPADAYTGNLLIGVIITSAASIKWGGDTYSPLYNIGFTMAETPMLETNRVNTNYQEQ